jgi:hypothetical protein
VGNKAGKVDTSVASQIKAAIRAQLEISRAVDRPQYWAIGSSCWPSAGVADE